MKAKFIFLALAVTGLFASCNEYTDDMEGLGKRVVALEDDVKSIDNSLNTLDILIQAIEKQGFITRIEDNPDGTYTIYLKGYFDNNDELTERTITLSGGRDGKGVDALLGVAPGQDGVAYWTFNGEPLTDENGNLVPVRGADGKDGKDGVDGQDGKNGKDASPVNGDIVLPMIRISDDDGTWEVSQDGGETWIDTNVPANGKDGKDGDPGKIDEWVDDVKILKDVVIFTIIYGGNPVEVTVPIDK